MGKRGIILLLALGLGACDSFVGNVAPDDAFHFPATLVLHPGGRYLYVVNTNFDVAFNEESGGTIVVVDTDTLQILPDRTVRMGSFGGRAVLSSDARTLWVAVRGDDSIVRLDVSEDGSSLTCNGGLDGLPCRLEDLSGDPYAISFEQREVSVTTGGTRTVDLLVVSHLQSNDITAISIQSGDPDTEVRLTSELTAGGSSMAIHPRTGNYYVVGRFDDRVRIFRPALGAEGDVAAIFSLGAIPLLLSAGNYDARAIAFTADGDRAVVAARNPHALLLLDTAPDDPASGGGSRDELVRQVDLDEPPEALALIEEEGRQRAYVIEFGADAVAVVDVDHGVIVDRFQVGGGPSGAVYDPDSQRLYVTLFQDNAVAVVDLDPESPRYRQAVARIAGE